MPSASEHRAKYDHNRRFLNTGLAATEPEWAAVVAFYAAVHLIERLAAAEPRGRFTTAPTPSAKITSAATASIGSSCPPISTCKSPPKSAATER
jgi:hypothetical protein